MTFGTIVCQAFSQALFFFVYICREKHDKAANISSLIWNPNNSNEMAIADVNGFFGLFEGISIDQKLVIYLFY